MKKTYLNNLINNTILVVVLLIIIFNHFIYNQQADFGIVLEELNNLQIQSLSILKELTKLLITLAIALFGFIGYFIFEYFKKNGEIPKKYNTDIILVFSFIVISIDFGYIYLENWVELLANDMFIPGEKLVTIPMMLQLIFLLLALFFAGRLVFRLLFKQK